MPCGCTLSSSARSQGSQAATCHRLGPSCIRRLALLMEAEVLDRIRQPYVPPRQTDLVEGPVEHTPGRSDEGLTRTVLHVAGLLTHEHQRGIARSLTEDRLRRVTVEVAAAAAGQGLHQRRDRAARREEGARTGIVRSAH